MGFEELQQPPLWVGCRKEKKKNRLSKEKRSKPQKIREPTNSGKTARPGIKCRKRSEQRKVRKAAETKKTETVARGKSGSPGGSHPQAPAERTYSRRQPLMPAALETSGQPPKIRVLPSRLPHLRDRLIPFAPTQSLTTESAPVPHRTLTLSAPEFSPHRNDRPTSAQKPTHTPSTRRPQGVAGPQLPGTNQPQF